LKEWPALAHRYTVERAFILGKTGSKAEARKMLEQVAEIDDKDELVPLRVEAASEAGRLALEMKDYANAKIWLDKAVKYQSLLTLYDSKWSKAAKDLQKQLPEEKK
jgi:tetratricopeptide (TPR) repeat protein